jgi:TonB family protein
VPRSLGPMLRSMAGVLLFSIALLPGFAADGGRGVKSRVKPVYPELARRMNICGTVKLQVTIAADGAVKAVKPLGGHPLLIDSAVNAVKNWKYETGKDETTELVSIAFEL